MYKPLGKPKIGISTCLLGKNVRFNGGHKLDFFLKDVLGHFVEYIPVCPELECGLGVPREAIEVHEHTEGNRLITAYSKKDVTDQFVKWQKNKVVELSNLELDGYIFKSKSPSCGVYRTRVYKVDSNTPNLNGRGLFAEAVIKNFSNLIYEEEGRLHNPELRDNFIQRVFIHYKWKEILKNKTKKRLVEFHQSLKYLLMSHSPSDQKELGQIVANLSNDNLDDIYNQYYHKLDNCLIKVPTKKRVVNVLDHIMGYFKRDLDRDDKSELKELINNYYSGLLPLIVPVTLINHYVRKYNQEYLKDQFFLNPYPLELKIRNNI